MRMRKAEVKIQDELAGILTEEDQGSYSFSYDKAYQGPPISLTLPLKEEPYTFDSFPPFFDGLLPEGSQLVGLLKIRKIDKTDYFSQLVATGADLVGAVTVYECASDE